jgi:hypothetical protein
MDHKAGLGFEPFFRRYGTSLDEKAFSQQNKNNPNAMIIGTKIFMIRNYSQNKVYFLGYWGID